MNFQNILLENEGQISTITINRPQSLNALNGATISELSEALSQLEQDSNCRVIIITGSGEKSFVAEQTLKSFLISVKTKQRISQKRTKFAIQ